MIKDSKEEGLLTVKTHRESTRGKRLSLHKQYKRIATTFSSKEARGHYLRMMMDAVSTEREMANRKKFVKPTESGE